MITKEGKSVFDFKRSSSPSPLYSKIKGEMRQLKKQIEVREEDYCPYFYSTKENSLFGPNCRMRPNEDIFSSLGGTRQSSIA
jgi:hypothetical protein